METFASDIKGRGLLVSLSIRQWTASKLDKNGSRAAAQAAGADEKRGNYHKRLVDPEMLKPIQKAARAARDYHERMTVPWSYAGVGMLPGESVMEYDLEMQALQAAFESEVDKFIQVGYPTAVAGAAKELGSYFDINEYPPSSEVRAKFGFVTHMSVLPDAAVDDFRVDIPLSVRDKIRNSVMSEYADLTNRTKDMLRDRAKHARDRIAAYHRASGTDETVRLHGTVISGTHEVTSLACRANIAGDESLAQACDILRRSGWIDADADSIRDSGTAREAALLILSEALEVLA